MRKKPSDRIVLSSGRYIKGMEMASSQLGIPVIFSAINGAIIKDGDEHLRRILIDRHPYEAAARYLKGRVKSLIAFSEMRFAIDARFYDARGRLTRVALGLRPGRPWVWGGWRARSVLECAAGDPAFSACDDLSNVRLLA